GFLTGARFFTFAIMIVSPLIAMWNDPWSNELPVIHHPTVEDMVRSMDVPVYVLGRVQSSPSDSKADSVPRGSMYSSTISDISEYRGTCKRSIPRTSSFFFLS
ncbi:hypothetical protein SARC_15460, partial [Sphaeroforma arctica JP610]